MKIVQYYSILFNRVLSCHPASNVGRRTVVLLAIAQELLVEVLVLLALLGDLLRHLLEQVHDPADRVLAQVLAASQDSCGYLS